MLLTQLETLIANKIWKDNLIKEVANAANHLAFTLNKSRQEFWYSKPPTEIVELLNSDIPSSLTMMQGSYSLGSVLNTWLDTLGLPDFNQRVPTSGHPDISFNGTQFVYTPANTPTPTPTPTPEPTPTPIP